MNKSKHTFFCRDLDSGVLSEEESLHAIRVLRMQEGDIITIINGAGKQIEAKILSSRKKEVGFEILSQLKHDTHPLKLHIAIAPTKNMDRFSFFLEKTAEMGIGEITSILSSNSERKNIRQDKAEKGLISAIKQSGNLFLPQLNEMIKINDFLSQDFSSYKTFIAHCDEDTEKKQFKYEIAADDNVLILIGPEGDFSSEEINLAKQKGFIPVSLGDTRLRTETAGILACHTVYLQ